MDDFNFDEPKQSNMQYYVSDPLVERVIQQIKQDIANNELECLDYLLAGIKREKLIAYLPDDEQSKFME